VLKKITNNILSVEDQGDEKYKVVLWTLDGNTAWWSQVMDHDDACLQRETIAAVLNDWITNG
jgi:hypothetical protein